MKSIGFLVNVITIVVLALCLIVGIAYILEWIVIVVCGIAALVVIGFGMLVLIGGLESPGNKKD